MVSKFWILCLVAGFFAAGSALAQDEWRDRKFLEAAIQENNLEIELGQLAEQHGNSLELRAYAQDLAQGHFPDRREANRTAAQLHMFVPLRGPQADRGARARLKALSAHEFDRAFVRFMAKRQAEDLMDFREEAAGGDATADLARRAVPIVQRQLETARRLDQALNGRPVSSR